MQCPNCQFHNMPGSVVCGRCASSLQLSNDAAIDVHPPRATAAALTMRRFFPYRSAVRRTREGLASILTPADERRRGIAARSPILAFVTALRRSGNGLPDGVAADALVIRAIAPGWAQWYAGQRIQAAIFFITYVILMGYGLWGIFTGGIGVTIGLAIAVHMASWMDITFQAWPNDSVLMRFVRSMATALVLMALLYFPPMWVLSNVAVPSRLGYTVGDTLGARDVLLLNYRGWPKVGRVVVFQTGYVEYANEGHTRRGYDGAIVDRILAGPGDRVAIRAGVVMINGHIASDASLNPAFHPHDFAERVIPNNSVFIVPSNVPERLIHAVENQDGIIPIDRVSAVVLGRIYPFSRFGQLH